MALSGSLDTEAADSRSGIVDDYHSDDDTFPHPPPKRRRVSHDSDGSNTPSLHTSSLSRVKRSAPSVKHDVLSVALPVPDTTAATFQSLNVAPWLVHSLAAMAIQNPTEIQRACIPEILKGRDCIGGSRTGTGKTVAFAVPILQQWAQDPFGIYAVILTPTRELALQIYEQFQALGTPQNLKTVLITGGSDMRPQAVALAKRPHIVVATPGRLAHHILTSGEETVIGLKRAKAVVLDEADRLLAPGPGSMLPDLNTCLSALPPSSSRLTLLFTATVTPEVRALKDLPRPQSRPPVFVSDVTDLSDPSISSSLLPSTLTQTYLQVPMTHKDAFLHVLLSVPSFTKSPEPSIIIFVNRTATADILHRTLLALSHPVTALHSELAQSQRNRNLADFRAQKARILIATDVASRGLDIADVNFVINYDVPRNPTDYVHRVGRTARAGRWGTSVTFVGQRDVSLILAIEEYVGSKMVEWTEEGVNVETRVVKGRTLKDVAEAKMEALRDLEGGKDVNGWRRKIKKDKKRMLPA
ncbi:P-loop containing nucleoside triphosphate hydrolase protein [Exophiala viscosa]|uniref:RNA helicase n=1 Tax=Exophiala viscosa TaxID=2486360 RepID=A0AAN6DRB2_9EURO|nr:P-loop containing nucleoside triphosphate hydrolase protein [Exophiala viscosa]KAI1623892.1 P-loop containing nucleoside triphosphate hydrolase protein [Exophiala viscosa]